MLKITLLTIGNKMPDWVEIAASEYLKRLKEFVVCECITLPLIKRTKNTSVPIILEREAESITKAIPKNAYVIPLAIEGRPLGSEALAQRLAELCHISSHLCFIIGGPDGLHPDILQKANWCWSLSPLTLPHPLVRVIVLEALYRAFAIQAHHPYHK